MRRALLLTALAVVAVGCVEPLDAGEWGTLRYFGEIQGSVPLRLIPPTSDRAGNVYVLYGAPDRSEAQAFVGHVAGGWSSGCSLHEDDTRGAHGWVGRAEAQAWYWSGEALVAVSGERGDCHFVLDRDPTTQTELRFEAVFPWVEDTPSQTRALALIRGAGDPRPMVATIDLGLERYTSVRPFEPADALNVRVIGVGANAGQGHAFLVVRYDRGDQTFVEGRVLDRGGAVQLVVTIPDADDLFEDDIAGTLQGSDGIVAGITTGGDLLSFSAGGARREAITVMNAAGVHRTGPNLWLVGEANAQPYIATIDNHGNVGNPQPWIASTDAARAIRSGVEVLDDRSDPSPRVHWDQATSALGAWPFLSAYNPDPYALGVTGWLVAGPSYATGMEGMTSVAFGPVGISYP